MSARSKAVDDRPLNRPGWQLPAGVSRGTWDYVHSEIVATDYDAYFVGNSLFEFDLQILRKEFRKRPGDTPTIVADLGCGTGRALLPLVQDGFCGVAIDLSEQMLREVQRKASVEQLPVISVKANLVELDGLATQSIDHAMCLFSTLGMIRTEAARVAMLAHVRRILASDGTFVLHVHNFWFNLYDPGGVAWVANSIGRGLLDGEWERGDKFFSYRSVPQMFLHVFTRGELKRILRKAGFTQLQFIPLPLKRNQPLRFPNFFQSLRANGWIVVCR